MTFTRYSDDVDRPSVSVNFTDSLGDSSFQEADKNDDYTFSVLHSLPAPEEMKTDVAVQRSNMTKKKMGLIALFVFGLTAIVGMGVAIAAKNSKNNVDTSGAKKDLTPGAEDEFWNRHPDQDVTQRFREIANFLNQFGYTNLKTMTTQGTPQYMAVQFLANYDPAELDVPESTDYDDAMEFVQRYVVTLFYYSTNGSAWENQLNFLTNLDVCDWNEQISNGEETSDLTGVQCNDDGEVNYVFIPSNNLSGELPAELGLLEAMMQFSVFGNEITGPFPESLKEWEDLRLMAVESNRMSGPLPSWMGAWTQMEYLALGANDFSGPLPDGVFSSMPALIEVSLHDNNLSGSFDKFNSNTNLDTLLIQRNRLTGQIQEDTFINVPLRVLDMNNNQIGGQIPFDFYDIQFLALHNNMITGSIPEPQYENHVIKFLSVYGNQMTGELPDNIGQLQHLVYLDLSQNRLEGGVPPSISECFRLRYLYLGDNAFSSGFEDLVGLVDLTRLQELSLRNMGLTGPIPDFIGEALTSLVFLDLRHNELTDVLPVSLQNLKAMRFMLLSNNMFTGDVPDELASLPELRVLALDNNAFTSGGDVGAICGEDGPEDLVWLTADTTITCSCCTDQCRRSDSACGGSTLLSPNVDYGYERLRFVFSQQLIFDMNVRNDV